MFTLYEGIHYAVVDSDHNVQAVRRTLDAARLCKKDCDNFAKEYKTGEIFRVAQFRVGNFAVVPEALETCATPAQGWRGRRWSIAESRAHHRRPDFEPVSTPLETLAPDAPGCVL